MVELHGRDFYGANNLAQALDLYGAERERENERICMCIFQGKDPGHGFRVTRI